MNVRERRKRGRSGGSLASRRRRRRRRGRVEIDGKARTAIVASAAARFPSPEDARTAIVAPRRVARVRSRARRAANDADARDDVKAHVIVVFPSPSLPPSPRGVCCARRPCPRARATRRANALVRRACSCEREWWNVRGVRARVSARERRRAGLRGRRRRVGLSRSSAGLWVCRTASIVLFRRAPSVLARATRRRARREAADSFSRGTSHASRARSRTRTRRDAVAGESARGRERGAARPLGKTGGGSGY